MNRIIESDRILDGSSSSVHLLQNLVTLIFKKKMEILVIVMLVHNFLETPLIMAF